MEAGDVRAPLLLESLRRAAATEFYRSHWGDAWHEFRNVADLPALPTIDKGTLALHGWSMLTHRSFPDQVWLSGGTTWRHGDPIPLREGSAEERTAFERLRARIAPPDDGPPPVGIELISQAHGAISAGRPFVFQLPLVRPNHIATVTHLLTQELPYDDCQPRVSELYGAAYYVMQLATQVDAEGLDPAQFALERITSHTTSLPAAWRTFIQNALGAPVRSAFGLSEINGSWCVECSACSRFHLAPVVIGEFLAPLGDDATKVLAGIAELTLTSLHPFQSRQPLIRYRTGDLVAVVQDGCELTREPGFRVVGRLERSAFRSTSGSRVLVPCDLVEEVLATVPGVFHHPLPNNRQLGLGASPGRPDFGLELISASGLECALELKTEAAHGGSDADHRALVDRVRSALGEVPVLIDGNAAVARWQVALGAAA